MDLALPFGSAISCAIFEDIATLLHWIFEQRMSVHFVHYLDDYLWVHKHFLVCLEAGQAVRQVAQQVGLPLAEDKFFGPSQVLDFLGLTIDSICMVVVIPQDKAASILKEIQQVMGSKKCHVKELQALAGRLNFITKAVPHGCPFSRRLYDMFAGMKPHWHVLVTAELRKDLQMWKRFNQEYGGWTPILLPETPVIHLYTCSDHRNFRLGCLVGHSMGLGYMGPGIHVFLHTFNRFLGTVCSSCCSLDLVTPIC